MLKRELGNLNGTGENAEGSRSKRRRAEVGGSSSDVDVTMSDPIEPNVVDGVAQVKEQGLRIWQTVKDAVNKEGRLLSEVFLHKPPKKQYPDYYVIISRPIALDDIKKRLDSNSYATLSEVKMDFELLFSNAMQYNMPESQIVLDAKELLKIVHKFYNKMVTNDENVEPKSPNLTRLIKTRLEKLVAKTDFDGRVLSDEFMQLPSRKLWPIYYSEIKHPQCFDNIFKHVKRKEYQTSADFAADVELVFSNATTFNQEHSLIWNDAVKLREYFHQLMSDMPPPHNLPQYAKPTNKIKIKPPQAASSVATKQESASSSLLLRVPAHHPPKPTSPPKPVSPPKMKPVSQPKAVPTPAPTLPVAPNQQPPKPPKPAPKQHAKVPASVSPAPKATTPHVASQNKASTPLSTVPTVPQTISFVNATPSHYPRTPYAPPPPVPTAPIATPTPVAAIQPSLALNVAHSTSQSPAPTPIALPPNHQLKSIDIYINPKGRTLSLDHRDGVTSWALRLMHGETSLNISNVGFLGEEDDEDSVEEEEEEDMDMDVDVEGGQQFSPSKNGPKKGKGRGRGRPPKAATLAAKAAQAAAAAKAAQAVKKKAVKLGEVQLKLNKFAVNEQPDKPGEWSVNLPVGFNTIEIGEVGGMIWKIYAERLGEA